MKETELIIIYLRGERGENLGNKLENNYEERVSDNLEARRVPRKNSKKFRKHLSYSKP